MSPRQVVLMLIYSTFPSKCKVQYIIKKFQCIIQRHIISHTWNYYIFHFNALLFFQSLILCMLVIPPARSLMFFKP